MLCCYKYRMTPRFIWAGKLFVTETDRTVGEGVAAPCLALWGSVVVS